MEELDLSHGGLTELPHIPDTTKILHCNHNNLVSLPPLPDGLEELRCFKNKLTSLPALPPGILKVDCDENEITVLPSLPPGLIKLSCDYNKLTVIPTLPATLEELYCNENNITSLPPLPPNLKILESYETFLKTIPELPESLIELRINIDYLEEPYNTFYQDYEDLIFDREIEEFVPERMPDAIKLLRKRIHNFLHASLGMWKGFTRSDVSKLDVIFGEKADDYAMCPVCLRYVQREDGCMYMKHNCKSIPGYYHKKLYAMYKTPEGNICWCTICGRIALGHRHYKLHFQDIPENVTLGYLRELRSSLLDGGNPFDKDCHWTNGGGSLNEKLQRFRRYREYALALQHEIDQITAEDALDQLVEEVWNAPMRREKRAISKMRAEKKWNIPENAFPPNAAPANNRNSNAPNVPFDGEMPTKIDKGTNVVMMNDDIPVIKFHHRQKNGDMEHHGVAEGTLEGFIQNTSPTDDAFGYCFAQPACNAKLHPEEIKPYVSEAIYKRYKKHFNIKFKAMTGGVRNNIVQEATDAMCVVVKRGGRTRSKRRSKGAKTRHR
jgi:hypothetical protein